MDELSPTEREILRAYEEGRPRPSLRAVEGRGRLRLVKGGETNPADHAAAPAPFPMVWFRDMHASLETRDFVQGLLVEESAIMIFGESTAGKTFWTTDLALHIAAGLEWNGRRVEQSGVIYCALEGGFGLHNRIAAWKQAHGLEGQDLPFAAIQTSINLFDAADDINRLVASILAAKEHIGDEIPVRLVIIDTLARAMAGGNENSPEDMGTLVANMDFIREQAAIAAAFVHHSGKDQAKGARGHSALKAAVDTEIEVAIDEENARSATVIKQRELDRGDVFRFSLTSLVLGENRHGEPVRSCFVEHDGHRSADSAEPARFQQAKRQPKQTNEDRALSILANLLIEAPEDWRPGVPERFPCVSDGSWREKFFRDAMPGDKRDSKSKAFRRASNALISIGRVGMANERVWICAKPDPDETRT